MKKALKIAGIVLLAIVLIVGGYFAYFFGSWTRLPDNIELPVVMDASAYTGNTAEVPVGEELSITSYNIGFGAYSPDYGFFMDGGTESWAWSEEEEIKNTNGAISTVASLDSDFVFLQEVDIDGTRSYHVNQLAMVVNSLKSKFPSSTYAISYDCPFIMYPLTQPHGKNRSCMVTMSEYEINTAYRRSLPIDEGLTKVLDLDRCFSVSDIDVQNGKKLYLYNLHLSAYSGEAETLHKQLDVLYADIKKNYEGGNYIIVGGDFNQDMPGNSSDLFGVKNIEASWTKAFERNLLPDMMRVADPVDGNWKHASCRAADGPFVEGESYVITVDGFLVSDNIEITEVDYINLGYAYSDHDPVKLTFKLK